MPFVDTAEVRPRSPVPRWSGRFVDSQNVTVVFWNVDDGAKSIHQHRHVQEELWSVIEGEIEITIDGFTRTAGPGVVAIVASGACHSVRTLGPCRVIVVDHPKREAFGAEA